MSDGFVSGEDMTDEEVEQLLEDLATRFGSEEPSLLAPPADVWTSIEDQLDTEARETAHSASGVTALDHHRRRRRPGGILLGAVAASLVAAVAVGAVLNLSGDDVVGEVDLASLTTRQPFGTARVIEDGERVRLDVDLDDDLVARQGQFHELWIIDTRVEGMYSLGRISGDGTFAVPEGVDVADFPIVDISVEADDGDPTHSGNSVYRGTFDF